MITTSIPELGSVSRPATSFRGRLKARIERLVISAQTIAYAAWRWARGHVNWFWMALAAILGLIYIYVLLFSSSPRWH